jgi:hypothetical protein
MSPEERADWLRPKRSPASDTPASAQSPTTETAPRSR